MLFYIIDIKRKATPYNCLYRYGFFEIVLLSCFVLLQSK